MTSPTPYGKYEFRIYYEDTDHSGAIYHPNYLKYWERAREHLLGPDRLVDLWNTEGLGFVVTKCEMNFKEAGKFGDELEIRTTPEVLSAYRIGFDQQVWKKNAAKAMVFGKVEMVCVSKEGKMVPLPEIVLKELERQYGTKRAA